MSIPPHFLSPTHLCRSFGSYLWSLPIMNFHFTCLQHRLVISVSDRVSAVNVIINLTIVFIMTRGFRFSSTFLPLEIFIPSYITFINCSIKLFSVTNLHLIDFIANHNCFFFVVEISCYMFPMWCGIGRSSSVSAIIIASST